MEKQCLHACFTATERSGSPAAISSTILHIDDGRKKERERVRLKTETGNTTREKNKLENCIRFCTTMYSLRASPAMADLLKSNFNSCHITLKKSLLYAFLL